MILLKMRTISVSNFLESGGSRLDYIFKLDAAKEIAMVENNTQGKLVRR
ncbi:antA/AntB antirepressor family protein [Tepidibacter hydrothermalis]|uniref:AntA/AntB antirepressor family protein n=1 Tax=Tepidibacter hydrothermalis TaxID=3036126 RepID=A0ABY8E727_9FIRM|nr:antA/AntB antirepressor family protein [Tepidibacter hydrothermalis]WFD08688.1 antA/AntB antirepressor family protein [Tepidibacter hydrothermalis]